jgi:hypothetical protein
MWEQQDSSGLSAHALVPANVWHPSSFVRSLQLVIYRIWNSRDGRAPGKTTEPLTPACLSQLQYWITALDLQFLGSFVNQKVFEV